MTNHPNRYLSATILKRHGLERGAYDGARRRRFVLFQDTGNGTVSRREFDTKRERDDAALKIIDADA